MKKISLFCIIICIVSFTLSGCNSSAAPLSSSGIFFDTLITVTLYEEKDYSLMDDCFLLADKYENLFSKTIEDSDVFRINHSKGEPVMVDKETIFLLEKALEYAKITEGVVDPTILPLSDLWDFGNNTSVPSESEIEHALSLVDYTQISIDKTACTVILNNENAGIDLGFIAKGYIADKMKEFLVSKGVSSALINLGGNVLTIGTKPKNELFRIGIKLPFEETSSLSPSVYLNDKSLVTSGVYERYFYQDNVLYHHILDTKTGYPINSGLYSVTIYSSSSLEGDAYSTICMCLGLESAIKLIENTEGIEALFITDEMEQIPTKGFPTTF